MTQSNCTTNAISLATLTLPNPASTILSAEIRPFEETLAQLEVQLDRAIKGFFKEAGRILSQIRDRKLYKSEFTTFEDYCQSRWGFGRQSAYQYIRAYENVQRAIQNGLPEPTSIREALALGKPAVIELPRPAHADEWELHAKYATKPQVQALIMALFSLGMVREGKEDWADLSKGPLHCGEEYIMDSWFPVARNESTWPAEFLRIATDQFKDKNPFSPEQVMPLVTQALTLTIRPD